MSEQKAIAHVFGISDKVFFEKNPARMTHIRFPFKGESEGEFFSLGGHSKTQRRILLWRVPSDSPYYDPVRQPLMKIPFLAFEDEDIADTDEVLVPLIEGIMQEQAAQHG